MIHTIIVEDDPMVTQIERQYLQQLGGFAVSATFASGQEALDYLRTHPTDLAILDVYMPGVSGSELLRRMRAENLRTAVIMVTAATETRVVDEALRLGIVDYLIKPFSFARFQAALQKYLRKADLLGNRERVDQSVVDRLLGSAAAAPQPPSELRKGLNAKTLDSVLYYLQAHPQEKHTCESISAASGLSKVTVRRYLNYLIEVGQAESSIDYETGGRPRVLYRLK